MGYRAVTSIYALSMSERLTEKQSGGSRLGYTGRVTVVKSDNSPISEPSSKLDSIH